MYVLIITKCGSSSVRVCTFVYIYFCECVCLDPPNVSSLTVDGHEVDGDYIIEEGKKTDIFCVFDKGNPQVSFQLLDKYRYEIKSSVNEEHLSYSLTARCKHDWPMVSCEGSRSTRNRSVSFLVRCKYDLAFYMIYLTISSVTCLFCAQTDRHVFEIHCLSLYLSTCIPRISYMCFNVNAYENVNFPLFFPCIFVREI